MDKAEIEDQKYGEWWTAPAVGDGGEMVMVSGREDVDKFRKNPKFTIRVDIAWKYEPDASGMPDRATAELMEQATDALKQTLRKDPAAVLTGIFTGEGRRDYVFYTLSTNIFGKKLNEALADLPLLPLEISCENDPDWAAYDEMDEIKIRTTEE